MEPWGILFFVSLTLFSAAVGSFGVKQLDKVDWRCFVAAKLFHRDMEMTGAKTRSLPPQVTLCEL